jgi:hypothetical protein
MISQTVLPFKIASTDETLTAQAGLALFGEYCHALGLSRWLDEALPAPGSGAGYAASSHALSVLFMLHAGGRSLEDLRVLRTEAGLLALLKLESVPSSDASGDWLRRMGEGAGLDGLQHVQQQLLARALAGSDCTAHTLDIDATQIVAEKETARWTYKGEQGYMPMVGHLAETGLVIADEFREGNAAPASCNLEFIQTCEAQLPCEHRIAAVRADSAAYQADIINACEAHGQFFAIGAARDTSVNAAIASIPETDWQRWRDGEIAETLHSMNRTDNAFRLIVVRRGNQGELFEADASPYRYTVIASNRNDSAAATMAWYCQRGEASENRIKELKIGFGQERMPCGQFEANAVFFRLGVLAYNLFKGFTQSMLDASWHRHQVQTLRWRVYQTAGKIVRHAGQRVLKINTATVALFESIRERCWALAVSGAT